MTTERAVRDAAFWDETICLSCGDRGGEPNFICFKCSNQTPLLPAKTILAILDSVEREDEEDPSC